jgi:hypothetical protein
VANADYHHRQARTILLLAASTRDRDAAAALIKLAGEHTALANAATAQGKPSTQEARKRQRGRPVGLSPLAIIEKKRPPRGWAHGGLGVCQKQVRWHSAGCTNSGSNNTSVLRNCPHWEPRLHLLRQVADR